jgi:hypothetical protein
VFVRKKCKLWRSHRITKKRKKITYLVVYLLYI